MSVIRVRRTDENNDLVRGNGKQDFVTDLDAVVQIIKQKLLFFRGEWWENENDGIPMFQQILGKYGMGSKTAAIDSLLQDAITSAPYGTGIAGMSSFFNASQRTYSFTATVNTNFGPVVVSNA